MSNANPPRVRRPIIAGAWLLAGLAVLLAAAPIVTARPAALGGDDAPSTDAVGLPRAAQLACRIIELRTRLSVLERQAEILKGQVAAGNAQELELLDATAERDSHAQQLAILAKAVAGERAACEAAIELAASGKNLFTNGRMNTAEWMQLDAARSRAKSALEIYAAIAD